MGSTADIPDIQEAFTRYEQERQKRIRADGAAQFADVTRTERFHHLAEDPWYDADQPLHYPEVAQGGHVRAIILGSGYGALLFAGRLIEAGISPDDMVLVDAAAGFGGAWYWNRYPGLMCDVESSCYMPFLEETGYTPKHRYSYGQELREYANLVAKNLGVDKRAMFRTTISKAVWDEESGVWQTTSSKKLPNGRDEEIRLDADFFILAAGILVHPKIPLIPGIESFQGHSFHTGRWDYKYTGGSQQSPYMENLKDKRVAFLGTGATAIQAIPQLAKWAKELYVIQRTPSSVDTRGQSPIDPAEFAKLRTGKGWQRARQENFAAWLSNPPKSPEVDVVNDGWTSFPSFSGLVGSPRIKDIPPEKTPEYIEYLHTLDLPRQLRIRQRVDSVVKDRAVAESLKPWYAGWCKRPCFHDEYLEAFNERNVHLVDTHGLGVEKITENSFWVEGKEYEVDLLILGTGFESWGSGSPAYRAGITVIGRDGLSMDEKWDHLGVGTLHGVISRGFPNLFLPGGAQGGATVNQVHSMDIYASHVADIINQATKKAAADEKVVIEPTEEGEETWTGVIMTNAHGLAGLLNCTPSYITGESDLLVEKSHEEQLLGARRVSYTPGILDFTQLLKAWQVKGDLEGLGVSMKPINSM